ETLKCIEAGAVDGLVWNGSAYVPGTPVGASVASSEPELVAEEGGQVGQIIVTGLGVDAGADTISPGDWVFCKGIVLATILGIGQRDNPGMIKYTCHLILQDGAWLLLCARYYLEEAFC
ncbi:unnamed protein product, partial [marine sediment metagenome]